MKISIILKPHRCNMGEIFAQAGYHRIQYNDFAGYITRNTYISSVPKEEAMELYSLLKEQSGSYNVIIAVKGTQESKEKLREYFNSIESMILGDTV